MVGSGIPDWNICKMKRLRKTIKNLNQKSHCPDQDLNLAPPRSKKVTASAAFLSDSNVQTHFTKMEILIKCCIYSMNVTRMFKNDA
jgi:hypothetical protein